MQIRNFAIVAHIDHGKSTLADRMLEITGTIKAGSGEQLLDTMELEKERGITIKLNPVRMIWEGKYQLNLIDTPGHVDFSYEVSRSLAAVEGVILLVDASSGVQAQTISNLHLVRQLNLAVIPVVNKIDLPTAMKEETALQLMELLDCQEQDIVYVSGKTGEGVRELLNTIASKIPPPKPEGSATRALVFDSFYDSYLGVVAYLKVVGGSLRRDGRYNLVATKAKFQAEQVGYLQIKRVPTATLESGEIGYVATGLKQVAQCRVGDTIVELGSQTDALPGYRTPKPMVFASLFPEPEYERLLTAALERLQLSDASLVFEPISSPALGAGYRVGFLGLLHLEIIKERLEREFEISVLVTTPTVAYKTENDLELEPWVDLEIVAPKEKYGQIAKLASSARAVFVGVEYFADQVLAKFEAPLSEIIVDFFDRLKSVSSGYASMDYQFKDYRPADLVTVDLLIAGEKIEALSQKVIRSKSLSLGRETVERLKQLIPRQSFEVSIQAAIGGKVIARADIPALRKDVTAKLYGGDVTRKRKLLEKQKKGKRKMRLLGKVEVPTSVFVELLRR